MAAKVPRSGLLPNIQIEAGYVWQEEKKKKIKRAMQKALFFFLQKSVVKNRFFGKRRFKNKTIAIVFYGNAILGG